MYTLCKYFLARQFLFSVFFLSISSGGSFSSADRSLMHFILLRLMCMHTHTQRDRCYMHAILDHPMYEHTHTYRQILSVTHIQTDPVCMCGMRTHAILDHPMYEHPHTYRQNAYACHTRSSHVRAHTHVHMQWGKDLSLCVYLLCHTRVCVCVCVCV